MPLPWSRTLPNCRWVAARLPLRAGDDLGVSERRLVDRHLIGCGSCRDRAHALDQALAALTTAAVVEPDASPSLWPEIRRQIRRSRHERRPIPLTRWAAAAVVVAGLGVLLAATGFPGFRGRAQDAPDGFVSNRPALPTGTPTPAEHASISGRNPVGDPHVGSAAERGADPQRSY